MDWRAQPAPVKDKPQEEEEEIDQLDESEEESDEAPKEVSCSSFFCSH